jgi:Arc/MetJ-type ribon-helix-helix transcriptional regulator
MKTLTVKLDEQFATEIENFQKTFGYANKSEMVREALRKLMVDLRRAQLQANLKRYIEDEQAQMEAADAVESRMALTEEALERAEK